MKTLLLMLLITLAGCSVTRDLRQLERRTAELETRLHQVSNTRINERIVLHYDPPAHPVPPSAPRTKPSDVPENRPDAAAQRFRPANPFPTPSRVEIVREIENMTETRIDTKAAESTTTASQTKTAAGTPGLTWMLAGVALALLLLVALLLVLR